MRYQLRVVLREISPSIWRTLDVPGDLTLHRLHEVLQLAMGWEDAHLYLFQIDGKLFGEASTEWDLPVADVAKATVEEVTALTSTFKYEYDLGDSWIHEITLEQSRAGNSEDGLRCTGGARACPPEDYGGPPGYEMFLEAITDPRHEEHEAMLEWIGGQFDSEGFDVATVNRALSRL